MTKQEILTLIESLTNDSDIDDLLFNQGFAKPISDLQGFNELVATNKEIQGFIDSKITQSIETFKGNGMQKIISEKLDELRNELNPSETKEQKELRELKEKFANMELEKKKAELDAKFSGEIANKKIPLELKSLLLQGDEETITKNIELFETSMKSYIDSEVTEKLGDGYAPKGKEKRENSDDLTNELNRIMGIN